MLSLNDKAKQLKEQGVDIVNLTAGEPDGRTPWSIGKAAKAALDLGLTHYTPPGGVKELRKAIAGKLRRVNHIPAAWEEVVVGVGAKQVLSAVFQLLCEPGDEVLIPTPAWGTFIEQARLADATPVLMPLKQPFVLDAETVHRNLTNRTKILIVNTPSNPTGSVIPSEELKAIAGILRGRPIHILADEVYEQFIYDELSHTSIASLSKETRQQTITVNSFSKTYAMTGWRVGYAHTTPLLAQKLSALNSLTTSGTCSIAQYGALEAITRTPKELERMTKQYEKRRNLVLEQLGKISLLSAVPPKGAFYVFINIKKALNGKETSAQWCARLLEKKGVAVVPGEAFAFPGFMRISFAANRGQLRKGLQRIREFLREE